MQNMQMQFLNYVSRSLHFSDTLQPSPVTPSFGSKMGFPTRYHPGRVSFSRDDTAALDVRRKSAVSRLCSSGNYGPERNSDGTLILRLVHLNLSSLIRFFLRFLL